MLAGHEDDAARFVESLPEERLDAAELRLEDKGPIRALHWRGADDEDRAERAAGEIGAEAENAGLALHRGRKVLELRPPVGAHKGTAVAHLLREHGLARALFAGDDTTDLDAFGALAGLELGVRVAVASSEGPPELREAADLVVDGPVEFLDEVLRAL